MENNLGEPQKKLLFFFNGKTYPPPFSSLMPVEKIFNKLKKRPKKLFILLLNCKRFTLHPLLMTLPLRK